MSRTTLVITLAIWLSGYWTHASARTQSHDSIRQAAEEHVLAQHDGGRQELRLKVGQLDSRLKLKQCSSRLETFSPTGRSLTSRQTVGVRCSTGQPWTLYVPVSVSIMKEILVASRELPRGSIISAGEMRLQERDVTRLRGGYQEHPQQVVGRMLKRSLHQNDALLPAQILQPQTVQRGGRVTILARAGTLQVRMTGKALSGGSKGDLIEVLNESSQKRVEGTVVAPGVVEVPL